MGDYHDYVIKDGKYIGDFENMYKDCKDPWMQSLQPNKYSRISGILHIKNFNIKSVLECGSGLGYYTNWINKETNTKIKGIDISKEAITKAKKKFPKLDFGVYDVTKDLVEFKEFDCIMLSEILWYILPELNLVISALKEHFEGKYLIINQVFYKGTQKYGNEYFTTLDELIDYIPFDLLAKFEGTLSHETTIETSTLFRI